MILLLTALAGGIGGALRFLVDTGVSRINRTTLPLGTVVVNATACFALGLLTGLASPSLGMSTWSPFSASGCSAAIPRSRRPRSRERG